VKVVEDASHSIGADFAWAVPVGACPFRHLRVQLSPGQDHHHRRRRAGHHAGCPRWPARWSLLRSHGITRDPAEMTHAPDGPWYYQQVALGYNYRMTEMQAALACSAR
jgi:hypothetical protein